MNRKSSSYARLRERIQRDTKTLHLPVCKDRVVIARIARYRGEKVRSNGGIPGRELLMTFRHHLLDKQQIFLGQCMAGSQLKRSFEMRFCFLQFAQLR